MNALAVLVRAECIKLRRSLILGLALLFPLGLLVVSLLVGLLVIAPQDRATWQGWATYSLVPWASFLLPLLVCLLATLVLNLEHQNHQWKQVHCLPVSRWKPFAAKLILLLGLLLLAHLLLLAGFFAGGWALRLVRPTLQFEAPNLVVAGRILGLLYLASWAMASLHGWLAARFAHLGVNLGLGITGVMLILVVNQRPAMARFLPWAMPGAGLADRLDPRSPSPWLVPVISLAMGALLAAMGCWDAHHRESEG